MREVVDDAAASDSDFSAVRLRRRKVFFAGNARKNGGGAERRREFAEVVVNDGERAARHGLEDVGRGGGRGEGKGEKMQAGGDVALQQREELLQFRRRADGQLRGEGANSKRPQSLSA